MTLTRAMTIILCSLPLCAEGCINPFAPRLDVTLEAQSCSDLTTTDNVFCTFRNAYSFRDTTLYGSIIGSDFTFTYPDYDKGVDISWGRTDEMRTTYGLFQSAQSLTLIWNDEISSSGSDTLKSIERGFDLTVTFNPSDVTRIDGYALLTFARSGASAPWRIRSFREKTNFLSTTTTSGDRQ
jgi:hypothetical protein